MEYEILREDQKTRKLGEEKDEEKRKYFGDGRESSGLFVRDHM